MIMLDATTKKLQLVLAGAVTTNQLPYTAGWVDYTTTAAPLPATGDGASNSTTLVDIVAAPSASTQRKVTFLSVYNKDTVTATVTISLNDNGTTREIVKVTLAVGASLIYDENGFYTVSSSGATTYVSNVASADGSVTVTNPTTTPDLSLNCYWDDRPLINGYITASVASNILTVAIKEATGGSDPSSTSPVKCLFRNATATSGSKVLRSITSATSMTVSNGSHLGQSTTNFPFRVWVVLFDDGGTLRLGVICNAGNCNVYPIRSDQLASSTAEGGAGGATSSGTFYTGTAVTSKPFVILGYLEYENGLASAGAWASAPTKIQNMNSGVSLPGTIVQSRRTVDGAVATGTATIPNDDTIPQNTEGNQYLSQPITPTSKANILNINAALELSNSAGPHRMVAALFQDSTANALTAAHESMSASSPLRLAINYSMYAQTTISTTFKVRGGFGTAGTTTFNGISGGREYGGVSNSFIQVDEIMV